MDIQMFSFECSCFLVFDSFNFDFVVDQLIDISNHQVLLHVQENKRWNHVAVKINFILKFLKELFLDLNCHMAFNIVTKKIVGINGRWVCGKNKLRKHKFFSKRT